MIEKTNIKFKKGISCLLAALQIGVVAGCNPKEDDSQITISKEEYESLLDELEQKEIAIDDLDLELHNLIDQINHLEAQNNDLNNSLNDLDYLRKKLAAAETEDFANFLKENNTATVEGEIDIEGDYWRARRDKVGDKYHCVIDITGNIPLAASGASRLKEIIDFLYLATYLDYPGDIELNISLDKLTTARLSDIPFEKFTTLNILPSEKMEIDENFTMPSFGELESVFFDVGTFTKISNENIVKLFSYVSKHNGNITIDRLGNDEKAKIEEIADDIKDMHFRRLASYWVYNKCLDIFKYIPAETVVPVIYGKYSYSYLPNAKYTLNDATNNLSLYWIELKEGISVESNHSVNLELDVSKPFYDVKFNLPKDSNIDIGYYDNYLLFTENTLNSLSQYNVTFNDGKTLQSDVNAVKEMNTLSKNIKLEMLENKEYRRFKITLNIPKEGISEKDYLDLENIISFCNTYGDVVFDDLTVNAYNEKDLDTEMIKHLYFGDLRNVTFNNYGGNISFLNIFNSSNGCGYTKLTFNNYSKVNDYDLLNRVVSKYTADNGKAILNYVNANELCIIYSDGSKDGQSLPLEAKVEKLIGYGYSEEDAYLIASNNEDDKIFYFYVYVNGEKYKISYEKTYSLTKAR